MAVTRSKENPGMTHSDEIVFREVIKDQQDIDRKIRKLRNAAQNHEEAEKFRLYISVNARNTMTCFFNYMTRMQDWVKQRFNNHDGVKRKFKRVDSHWKSELQRPTSRDEVLFIWDLDDVTTEEKQEFLDDLPVEPVLVQETPNGYHIVTEPFNYNHDMDTEIEYELKTDGMLFLEYINTDPGNKDSCGEPR